jgi:acetoin utilization deacetylase AcuC-like enzyme
MKATQGTIDGTCLALEHKWAINLAGGYHHATKSSGGGFCIYPDITMAVHHLRKFHSEIVKVMIIDLDAHQGNGYERDFLGDSNIFILDCFNRFYIKINLVIFILVIYMQDKQFLKRFMLIIHIMMILIWNWLKEI